jgi:hypothetical protein
MDYEKIDVYEKIACCFLFCCTILILSYTQEHFHLVEGVSLEAANIVFNEAA